MIERYKKVTLLKLIALVARGVRIFVFQYTVKTSTPMGRIGKTLADMEC